MAKGSLKPNHGNAREFGVLSGTSGPHASRTMALEDLSTLLDASTSESAPEDYSRMVVEENLLVKATEATRKGQCDGFENCTHWTRQFPCFVSSASCGN